MSTRTAPTVRHSRTALAGQLSELGVERNGVLLVHASMRAVGSVSGGVRAVVAALRDALGRHGTLVVPAFTPENSDSSQHYLDRVRGLTDRARDAVRASMPPFDPATSAAPSMGRLAEAVRLTEGAARSVHPQTSFAALGPSARKLVAHHRPDCHLGEDSPLARLYGLRAQVLLLGTGFDTCTAFHLGEYRMPAPPRRTYRCVVSAGGASGGSTRTSRWTTPTSRPWERISPARTTVRLSASDRWGHQRVDSSASPTPSTSRPAGCRHIGAGCLFSPSAERTAENLRP